MSGRDGATDVVVVAVNDSQQAFAAARVAVEYARRFGATVHAVTVIEPWEPSGALRDVDATAFARARERSAEAALRYVRMLGEGAGVEVDGVVRQGAVAECVLAEAEAVRAGLVVLARVSRPRHALPYVGSQTLRVLEFATVPVLVVPTSPR